jgi:glycosyltransferase involved in cell wall biosynthesis
MRILIIIDDLRGGGTENVLASRLAARGDDTEALVLSLFHHASPPPPFVEERLRGAGVETRCLNLTRTRYPAVRREIRGVAAGFKPEVAICMRDVSRALFPSMLAAAGIPVALFWDNPEIFRSFRYFPFEWWGVRRLRTAKFAPYCSTARIAEALKLSHGLRNVTIIPNCYDQKRFTPRKREIRDADAPVKIVAVGSARPEKNHADKIEIAKHLKASGRGFAMTIVGQDVPKALAESVKNAGLEHEISLIEASGDVPAILADSDIFLSTSTSEGMPVSLLEATATGLPSLAYAFPGLDEINSGQTVVDVIPMKHIDKMVERLIYWSANPREAQEFGNAAAEITAGRFGSVASAKQWESFLRSITIDNPPV